MSKYSKLKAKARETAINWQMEFNEHNYSWAELYDYSVKFERLAKRYGLVKEFKENGII